MGVETSRPSVKASPLEDGAFILVFIIIIIFFPHKASKQKCEAFLKCSQGLSTNLFKAFRWPLNHH